MQLASRSSRSGPAVMSGELCEEVLGRTLVPVAEHIVEEREHLLLREVASLDVLALQARRLVFSRSVARHGHARRSPVARAGLGPTLARDCSAPQAVSGAEPLSRRARAVPPRARC
jgi:hypothetical protein